jgi:hypothetical protein
MVGELHLEYYLSERIEYRTFLVKEKIHFAVSVKDGASSVVILNP